MCYWIAVVLLAQLLQCLRAHVVNKFKRSESQPFAWFDFPRPLWANACQSHKVKWRRGWERNIPGKQMLVFIANIVHGRAGKQYSLGINISFLQSRKQPRSKKVKEGLNRKLFTRLNAKWLVFTSVNSFQFSPAIYCFSQMVSSHRTGKWMLLEEHYCWLQKLGLASWEQPVAAVIPWNLKLWQGCWQWVEIDLISGHVTDGGQWPALWWSAPSSRGWLMWTPGVNTGPEEAEAGPSVWLWEPYVRK